MKLHYCLNNIFISHRILKLYFLFSTICSLISIFSLNKVYSIVLSFPNLILPQVIKAFDPRSSHIILVLPGICNLLRTICDCTTMNPPSCRSLMKLLNKLSAVLISMVSWWSFNPNYVLHFPLSCFLLFIFPWSFPKPLKGPNFKSFEITFQMKFHTK